MARRRKSRAPAVHRGQRIRDRPRRGPVSVDLIQHVVGEHRDVKRIHPPLGLSLRIALGDRAADPVGPVGGDQVNLLAAHFAERVEELKHRATGPGPARPRQPSGVMIDHDDQIPLALAEADLIDPDPPQPVEHVHLDPLLVSHLLKDLTGRSQTTRISSATAVFDVFTVSHTSWSSGALVNRESCLASGTAATTTPWRQQRTRSASASTNARHVEIQRPPSAPPWPRSGPGGRRRYTPRSDPDPISPATITSSSLAIVTSSTTARRSPSGRFHTLIPRTLHPLHRIAVFDCRER